jgi:hypothetical protein
MLASNSRRRRIGDDAQGELLAGATNHKGRVGFLDGFGLATGFFELVVAPVEVGELLSKEALGDFAGFTEAANALARGIERQTHAGVFVFVPASTHAKVEAATRDNVDSSGHVGMHGGVAVGVAGDHQADAQALGLGG